MDKIKAFLRKYKNIITLSICFAFAFSVSFLLPGKKAEPYDESEVSETRAFISKGKDESVDKKYKEEKIEVMPEERPVKEIVIPEAFPDSEHEKEPIVTREALDEEMNVPASVSASFSPSMPIAGEKITPYSVSPLYFSITEDWRSHEAIDLASELGVEVKAIEGGTVTFVGKNPLLGYCIRIKHSDTYESLYANLHGETTVIEGQSVTKGHIIGYVGESSLTESDLSPHLHFELFKNGKRVNPEEYLR